jgi:hypothetical protein
VKNWKESLSKTWLSLFSPSPTVEEEKEKPLLDQVETLVDIVDVNWFMQYSQQMGRGVVIETFYPNFHEYISLLELHVDTMSNNEPILESRCHHRAVAMPINRFFLSPDGYYENVHDNVLAFRDTLSRLCSQLRSCKDYSNALGNYNLRLLTPLLDNIKVVLLTLMEIKELSS